MSENVYTYTPPKESKKLKLLTGVFFFAALLLFAFSMSFSLPYEWLVELAAIVLLTGAILLFTRFVFKEYTYKIERTEEGGYDLVVDEITPRTNVTVCRVSLSNIERVELLCEKNADELRRKAKERKRFSYLPDLFVAEGSDCFVFVTECGEPLALRLSADKTLYGILKNAEQGDASEDNSEE